MKKFFALLIFLSNSAFAVTGTELEGMLNQSATTEVQLRGLGYLQGVWDAERMHVVYEEIFAELEERPTEKGKFFCVPEDATLGQVRDVVKGYLATTSKNRHYVAAHLVHDALHDAWPCSD